MTGWNAVLCTDDRLRGLYKRHYSSSKATRRRGRPIDHPNQTRFVGPGAYIALLTGDCAAGFVWRLSIYRKDGQQGIECTLFRNEAGRGCRNASHAHNSSRLINEACEIAWRRWPDERLFTFVDPKHASANPGYCFQLAGFKLLPGTTQRGLRVLERLP